MASFQQEVSNFGDKAKQVAGEAGSAAKDVASSGRQVPRRCVREVAKPVGCLVHPASRSRADHDVGTIVQDERNRRP